MLLALILLALTTGAWADLCHFTGCAVGRCTCMSVLFSCVTQDDANGVCTLTEVGIWTIVGSVALFLIFVIVCCVCLCCGACCCCRNRKQVEIFMSTDGGPPVKYNNV